MDDCEEVTTLLHNIQLHIDEKRQHTTARLRILQLLGPLSVRHVAGLHTDEHVHPSRWFDVSFTVDQAILSAACHWAAPDVASQLLAQIPSDDRARVLLTSPDPVSGDTYLHDLALSGGKPAQEMIRTLLKSCPGSASTLLQAKNSEGRTPLHAKCVGNSPSSTISTLLASLDTAQARFALIEDKDDEGRNAVMAACGTGSDGDLRVLCAAYTRDKPRLARLLASSDLYGANCLHIAAKNSVGARATLDYLLPTIASLPTVSLTTLLSQTTDHGDTLMHFVCGDQSRSSFSQRLDSVAQRYHLLQLVASWTDKYQLTARLLMTQNHQGYTPLHFTAAFDDASLADAVLRRIPEADRLQYVSTQTLSGRTALHIAALTSAKAFVRIVGPIPARSLTHVLCDVPDGDGCSVIQYTVTNSDSYSAALKMLDQRALVRALFNTNDFGQTALIRATSFGCCGVVLSACDRLSLPELFALVSTRDNAGWSILHHLCMWPHSGLLAALMRLMVVLMKRNMARFLLHKDHYGNTALHLAALLLNHGAIKVVLEESELREHEIQSLLKVKNADDCVAADLATHTSELLIGKYTEGLEESGVTSSRLREVNDTESEEARQLTTSELRRYENQARTRRR